MLTVVTQIKYVIIETNNRVDIDMKKQILNIVNFIRAVEPRDLKKDLFLPVKEQARLINENGLKGTFLVQYDALIDNKYTDFLKTLPEGQFEIGLWYEVVQPLCEDCDVKWTGRYSWDWHCHCGTPVGYDLKIREKLIKQAFDKFKEIFGYFPKVLGAWLFDTHTLRFVNDNYSLDALCCCKEQYGTDGYTLWGGVYGQGYYPSKNNWFIPAESENTSINIPMFRMLGSDPVYQYDFGLDLENGADPVQKVISLEPANKEGGANKKWIDWYLRENFNGKCLSFGYAQAGQENSFGWPAMDKPLTYQMRKFKEMADAGKIEVITLGEAGKYFKESFRETPPSIIYAENAYDNDNISSFWYSCKNYRINLYASEGRVWIRDIHLYSDIIKDVYDEKICIGNDASYEALPFIDGNRFSGNGILCRAYPFVADKEYTFERTEYKELNSNTAELVFDGKNGKLIFTLSPEKIQIYADKADGFNIVYGNSKLQIPHIETSEKLINISYNNISYALKLEKGKMDGLKLLVEDNCAVINCFDLFCD